MKLLGKGKLSAVSGESFARHPVKLFDASEEAL